MTRVMSKKFLGTMIAGVALGGASLLVGAPAIALADGGNQEGERGHVYTQPRHVKAGEEATIIEVCPTEQEKAYVWSKVTGKVELEHVEWDGENGENGQWHGEGEDGNGGNGQWHGEGEDGNGGNGQWHGDRENAGGEESNGEERGGRGGSEENRSEGRHGEEEKKHVYKGTVEVPEDTKPGRYELKGSCGEGTLAVVPAGWVDGGDGGAGTNAALALGGAGMIGAAAIGGFVLMRRRQIDGSVA
jgi:hypothetical protein